MEAIYDKYFSVKEIDELGNMTCEVFGTNEPKAKSYLLRRVSELKAELDGYDLESVNGGLNHFKFTKGDKFVEISLVETEV